MKSVKFKESFVDFESDDPLVKTWVKYFTFQRQYQEKLVPPSEEIRSLVSRSQVPVVNKSILKRKDANLRSNPRAALVSLLDLNQEIPLSVIQFCEKIYEKKSFIQANYHFFNSHIPNIIRAFICFIQYMEGNLENVVHSGEAGHNAMFMSLPKFVWTMMYFEDFQNDAILLISHFLQRFQICLIDTFHVGNASGACTKIILFLDELITMMENYPEKLEMMYFFVEFAAGLCRVIVQESALSTCYHSVVVHLFTVLVKHTSKIQTLPDKTYKVIVECCIDGLDSTTQVYEQWKELVYASINALSAVFRSRRDTSLSEFEVNKICKYLLNAIDGLARREITDTSYTDGDEAPTPDADYEFDFVPTEKDMLDTVYMKECAKDDQRHIDKNIVCIAEAISHVISTDRAILTAYIDNFSKIDAIRPQLVRKIIFTISLKGMPHGAVRYPDKFWHSLLGQETLRTEAFRNPDGCGMLDDMKVAALELAEDILSRNFDSEKGAIMNVLNELVMTRKPTLVRGVASFLRSALIRSFVMISSVLSKHSAILDSFIDISQSYRTLLKTHYDQELVFTRSEIFMLFRCFYESKMALTVLFSSNEKRILYMYSWLIERNENIRDQGYTMMQGAYREAVSTYMLIKGFTIMLKEMLSHFTEEMYIGIVNTCLEYLINSESSRSKDIPSMMLLCQTYDYISEVPAVIAKQYLCDRRVQEMIKKIVMLYGHMCKRSGKVSEYINKESGPVISNLCGLVDIVVMDSELMESILSLIVDEPVSLSTNFSGLLIRNYGFISVLNDWTVDSELYGVFLKTILSLTSISITNRYQCYRSRLLKRVLKFIVRKPVNETVEACQIFSLVGAMYFHKTEIMEAMNAIKHCDKEASVILLNIITSMFETRESSPKSFFHISERENEGLFLRDACNAQLPLEISMLIRFEKTNSISRTVFMKISNSNHQISVEVDSEHMLIAIRGDDIQLLTPDPIAIQVCRWHMYRFVVYPNMIEVYVDGEMKTRLSFNGRISLLSGEKLSFQISGTKCDIGDVSVGKLGEQPTMLFTAKMLKDTSCISAVGAPLQAKFNGVSVPFSPAIVDTLITAGGPKMYMPLFMYVKDAAIPGEYLFSILNTFKYLLQLRQEHFVGQNFFRQMAHLLHAAKVNDFPRNCGQSLHGIFKGLKLEPLRNEMIRYVWSDLSLIIKFQGLLPDYYLNDPELAETQFNFNKCFTSISNVTDKNAIPVLISFIRYVAETDFGDTQAKLLVSTPSNSDNVVFVEIACRLICEFIVKRNAHVITALELYNYFTPFYKLFASSDLEMRKWGVKAICLAADLKGSNTTNPIIQVISMCLKEAPDAEFVDGILDVVLRNETQGSDINYSIPLLSAIMQYIDDEKRANIIDDIFLRLHSSFANLPVNLNNWVFYLGFLMNLDKDKMRWSELLAFICCERNDGLFPVILMFRMMGCLYGWDFTSLTERVLGIFIGNNTNNGLLETETIALLLKLLLFHFDITKPTDTPADISLFAFAQKVIAFSTECTGSVICLNELSMAESEMCLRLLNLLSMNQFKWISDMIGPNSAIAHLVIAVMRHLIERKDPQYMDISNDLIGVLKSGRIKPSGLIKTFLLALLHHFRDDEATSKRLRDILFEWDADIAVGGDDVCMRIAESTNLIVINQANIVISGFAAEVSTQTAKLLNGMKTEYDLMMTCKAQLHIPDNGAIETLISDFTRMAKHSERLWKQAFYFLDTDIMGLWSSTQNAKETHRKLDKRVDKIGRHLRVERNWHFNNHMDASLARDNGTLNDLAPKQIRDFEITESKDYSAGASFVADCRLQTIASLYTGTIYLSKKLILFEGKERYDPFTGVTKQTQKLVDISLNTVWAVLWRKHRHTDTAIEIFTETGKSYFLIFCCNKTRARFMSDLEKMKLPAIRFFQTKSSVELFSSTGFTESWKAGKMSTYEYLYWCNMFSGRSFNDLSQYPVFPWVLSDYTSQTLNLNDPASFRDLSKPLGAINEHRLQELLSLRNDQDLSDPSCSSLYRVHYSSLAYVVNFLIRMEPFTSLHIALQHNKFDDPHRLFVSIESTWNSVVSDRRFDFRELIPEFYCCPEVLINSDGFDLGVLKTTGNKVHDVDLPKWAESAYHFAALHRLALESPYVSSHIHSWIDLIFGAKQRGKAATEAYNDFHPFSYSDSISKQFPYITTEEIQMHAGNFGITPDQIFTQHHPQRNTTSIPQMMSSKIALSLDKSGISGKDVLRMRFIGNSLVLLGTNGTFRKLSLKKDNKFSSPTVSRFTSTIPIFDSMEYFDKFAHISPDGETFVLATPWMDTFEVFDARKQKPIMKSPPLSSCISAVGIDDGVIVTGLQDSSVYVWDIKHPKRSRLFSGHIESIEVIAVSSVMDLLVTVDLNLKLLVSSVTSGKLYSSVVLPMQPKEVHLSDLGFIIVIYNRTEKSSLIELRNLQGKLLKQTETCSPVYCSCVCKMTDHTEFLACSLHTPEVSTYRLIDLSPVGSIPIGFPVIEMSFCTEGMFIIARQRDSEMSLIDVKSSL